ncbi:MAG: ferritin family protein [Kiritimatiellae bacterium]|nr:ferritin family protein [Kiritimatiellia bacterium]
MAAPFNPDEIFEIAEQIERNGIAFYRQAAGLQATGACRDLFLDLAKQEGEHLATFIALRKELAAAGARGLELSDDETAAKYLQAIAGGYVFDLQAGADNALSGKETLVGIVKFAMKKEEDSIILYLGMKDMLAGASEKDKIQAVIREEQKHLTDLAAQIGLLR